MYRYIKTHPSEDFVPRTFVFGAKASAGYDMAKQIISLICAVSEFLASDPAVNDKLKVVFLEDYRVSMAEIIIPAAEISQQISGTVIAHLMTGIPAETDIWIPFEIFQ